MKKDLKEIHKTHFDLLEKGSYSKKSGKTVYFASLLRGYLDILENETILVILPKFKDTRNFFHTFIELTKDEDLQPKFQPFKNTLTFKNNSNIVKFVFYNENFVTRIHDLNLREDYDIYPIVDLKNLSSGFYKDNSLNNLIEIYKSQISKTPHINSETGEYNLKFNVKDLPQDFYI